ncbi:MAG: hypothetical protein GC178_04140 [Flavobacteriales bacterium]|nr:hypothetical protein [Flavobacteriales bacterium]
MRTEFLLLIAFALTLTGGFAQCPSEEQISTIIKVFETDSLLGSNEFHVYDSTDRIQLSNIELWFYFFQKGDSAKAAQLLSEEFADSLVSHTCKIKAPFDNNREPYSGNKLLVISPFVQIDQLEFVAADLKRSKYFSYRGLFCFEPDGTLVDYRITETIF